MITSKDYNETTAEDFRRLFDERFPGGNSEVMEMLASNPARKTGMPMGRIAYDNVGRPVAIQGLALRKAFCRQAEINMGLAMVMAVAKDVDRGFFTPFLKETMEGSGADMIFGNTAIPGSRKRLQAAIGVKDGPESCAEIRERAVRSNGLVARAMRKVAARLGVGAARSSDAPYRVEVDGLSVAWEREIAEDDFNRFWLAYLESNEGLVSSRTAEELRWLFGKGLANGEMFLLTARKGGDLQGYAFCRRTDETAACWRVVDWIALGNDEAILAALIEGATRFLRARTPALCLQITGYPTWVQPLLKRLFPKSTSFGFNKCVWAYLSDRARTLCGDWVHANQGWYGCPYDGDMCLM